MQWGHIPEVIFYKEYEKNWKQASRQFRKWAIKSNEFWQKFACIPQIYLLLKLFTIYLYNCWLSMYLAGFSPYFVQNEKVQRWKPCWIVPPTAVNQHLEKWSESVKTHTSNICQAVSYCFSRPLITIKWTNKNIWVRNRSPKVSYFKRAPVGR